MGDKLTGLLQGLALKESQCQPGRGNFKENVCLRLKSSEESELLKKKKKKKMGTTLNQFC